MQKEVKRLNTELEQKHEQKTEEQKEKEEAKINSNNNNINNNINNNSDQNAMKAKGTELDLIKEGEEEEKEDEEETGNLINTSMTKEQHNDSYLLEKINSLDDSKGDADVENIPIFAGFSQFRNTVNSFNNKKFMFPKLHNVELNFLFFVENYVCGFHFQDLFFLRQLLSLICSFFYIK